MSGEIDNGLYEFC